MSNTRVYREGNKLVKIYRSDSFEYAEAAFKKQQFAYDAGLPVPAPLSVKKINDTETAIEMEYIEGKPLVKLYENRADEKLTEAMKILVQLQLQMHGTEAAELSDLTDFYTNTIKSAAYLSPSLKNVLFEYMRHLEKGKTNLCHGDFHPYNIIYNNDKFWIVDWEDASRGDPAADACMHHFYCMRFSDKNNTECDDRYLRIFCKESGIPREDVLDWLPVIAGVQINLTDEEDPDGTDRAFMLKFIDKWLIEYFER